MTMVVLEEIMATAAGTGPKGVTEVSMNQVMQDKVGGEE